MSSIQVTMSDYALTHYAYRRRYQSITNWFQNQRSLAKKRKEDEADAAAAEATSKTSVNDFTHESRTFSAFPPPSSHPSLPSLLQLPINHPALAVAPRARRSPSLSLAGPASAPIDAPPSPRRLTPRRSSTPYRTAGASLSRPRRTRPEPYQLDALKDLFTRTTNPSIEQRSALASEIGM